MHNIEYRKIPATKIKMFIICKCRRIKENLIQRISRDQHVFIWTSEGLEERVGLERVMFLKDCRGKDKTLDTIIF